MILQEVDEAHAEEFLKMMANYDAASETPPYLRENPKGKNKGSTWSLSEFKKFVKESAAAKMDWRPKAKQTSVTRYVMVNESGKIFASARLEFPLTEETEVDGGNLRCEVPPNLRRHGYGTYCLALLLFEAVRAGLRRALVTCPAGDRFSRSMIEKNRGVLQDIVPSTNPLRPGLPIARYWISFSG